MSRIARRLATIIALGLMLAVTAGCQNDEPEPIPKPTKPTSSVSPAPSGPELNAKQEADYKEAVEKYADYQEFVDRVAADPKVTDDRTVELDKLATRPATDDFSDSIDQLIKNEAHTEGSREVAWSSPVSVNGDEVVFLQCETPGTWVLVGSGHRAPQKSNTITKVTVIKYKDNWFVKDGDGAGKC